jgi:hypothetical protein
MFVQVIKGKVADEAGVRREGERWRDELRPGATGFLGSTIGVSEDGTVYCIARFEDEATARANSERPEQGEWWNAMAACLEGEATFRESSDTSLLFDGGSDDAGFVQVMEGSVSDRAKAEAFETPEMAEQLRAARPDLLGSVRAWFDGGRFVDVAYFTSEDDARKGEASEDFAGPSEEFNSLFEDMTFTDLKAPVLFGP